MPLSFLGSPSRLIHLCRGALGKCLPQPPLLFISTRERRVARVKRGSSKTFTDCGTSSRIVRMRRVRTLLLVSRSPPSALHAPPAQPTSHCACPIVSSLQGRIALRVSLFTPPAAFPPFFVYRCASITSERGTENHACVGDQTRIALAEYRCASLTENRGCPAPRRVNVCKIVFFPK